MLTIGQLADYVGVSTRAIRHYHRIGLLPEPARTSSGYRSYLAQDVVDLQRIKVLSDAGVPLSRVRELVGAGPEALSAAVREIDDTLRARIAALRRTRRCLARLADGGEPALRPEVVAMHERMSALGVSERTLAMERDAWVLIQVLYPDLVEPWLASQAALLEDPDRRELLLLMDRALDWDPEDPRIEEVARRSIEWATSHPPGDSDGWDADPTAYELVTTYRSGVSPALDRIIERVAELMAGAGDGGRAER